MSSSRSAVPLLIVFADLTKFAAHSETMEDSNLAETLDLYYRTVSTMIDDAGGRVVKFIGDGVLIVFPEESLNHAVRGLQALKKTIDEFMRSRGWSSRLMIKAHFGEVIAGPFGPSQLFDVIGKNVNAAAMLQTTGITLSGSVFERLNADVQREFREYNSPVIYIRVQDEVPFRRQT